MAPRIGDGGIVILWQTMQSPLLRHEAFAGGKVLTLTLPHPTDDERLDQLNTHLAAATSGKSDQRWIVDLSGVPYLGSSMLGWLVNLRHQIKTADGTLVLCGLSPVLIDLFRNSSMGRLFVIARDCKAALRR